MEFENMTFWQWLTITWNSIVDNGAAAWIITIVTVITLVYQIYKNNVYNKQLHELQRRVNAANTLYKWATELTKEESTVKRIVEQFNEKQVKAIVKEADKLYITKEQYDILVAILKSSNPGFGINTNVEKNNKVQEDKSVNANIISKSQGEENSETRTKKECSDCENDNCPYNKNTKVLNKDEIVLLRWYLIHYLNKLEAMLLQCKNGTVDADVMYEQLKYQYNAKDGVMALKKVRYAMGPEAFPAIEWFCIKLEEKLKNDILEKGYIDSNEGSIWNEFIEFLIKILNKLK